MKRCSLKTAMDAGLECSRGPSAVLGCSEILSERAPDPEPSGDAALREVNRARLARSCKWLMPKYCSTIYRILESELIASIAFLGSRPRKREKVEWSCAGWLKAMHRKVLKESRSLI